MGTYINFNLTILNNKQQSIVDLEQKKIVAEFKESSEDASYLLDEDGFATGDGSWDDLDEQLCEFSKRYPNYIFHMDIWDSGTGDRDQEYAIHYYMNGKIQRCPGEITYAPFSKKKLKELEKA